MIVIDIDEMADYITEELLKQNIVVKRNEILKVLYLEEDFLRLKGVIEEESTSNPLRNKEFFTILCSIDTAEPYSDGTYGKTQMDSFGVRVESYDHVIGEEIVSEKLKTIEKELIARFPTVYSLSSYPAPCDEPIIDVENLSVESIFSASSYLRILSNKQK